MKKKIINGLLFAVAMVAATSSFVSCKDYNGDNYAELQEKYLTLEATFKQQVDAMKNYVLQQQYDSEVGKGYNHVKTIQQRLNDLETDTAALAKRISDNDIAIKKALAEAKEEIMGFAKRDSQRLANLVCPIWGNDLDEAISKAAEVLATVAKDSATWNETSETVANRKAEWDRAVQVADKAWAFVENTTTKDGKKIESLQDLVNAYENADEALKEDIAALKQDVENILKLVQQQVTGIEIQATYNPVFGTFSSPVDIQTNILAAYYGFAKGNVIFPAGDKGSQNSMWASGEAAVLSSELDAIGAGASSDKVVSYVAGDTLMFDGVGNAGRIYLTVNPSDVIMDGKEFTLRASDNSISKVALSPLETCTEQLLWGYKRANSANGFYVANATISKKVANDVALSFNLKGVLSEVQDIMQDWSSASPSDIAKIAGALRDAVTAKVPRLGVQAQWKDTLGWKNYVSKYDLAAFSMKPIGYGELNGVELQGGIVKLKNKITAKEKAIAAELINKIAQALAFQLNLGTISTTNIKIDANGVKIVIPANTLTVSGNVQVDGNNVIIPANHFYTGVPSTATPLTYSVSNNEITIDITPLFTAIQDAINTKLAQVNSEASGAITKVLNKVIDVENKIFDKVISAAQNPGRFIQPALIAQCGQLGYFYPSRIYNAPTQIKRGTKIFFYPTTLTAELVAPAFKKYVAVVGAWNVNNMSEDRGAAQYNTGVLNNVFNGSDYDARKPFEYTVDAPDGTVLEFIYEAVGYNGKIAGKKYYIEVYE